MGFFVIALFHETNDIPTMDMKVQAYSDFWKKKIYKKNEISKLHEEWKISPFQL